MSFMGSQMYKGSGLKFKVDALTKSQFRVMYANIYSECGNPYCYLKYAVATGETSSGID